MQPFKTFGRTLLTIVVLLPLSFIIDLSAILQHNLLATGYDCIRQSNPLKRARNTS